MTAHRCRLGAALSLVEVVVAMVILSGLILVSASVLLTLERGTSVTATLTGLDQDARRVLSDVRTSLRQSGYHQNDTAFVNLDRVLSAIPNGVPAEPDETLSFLFRTDFVYDTPGGYVYTADEKATLDWGGGARYRLVAQGAVATPSGNVPTYRLEKVIWIDVDRDGVVDPPTEVQVVALCHGVTTFTAVRKGDSVFEVTLELTRNNPDRGASPSPPLKTRARERVQVLNAKCRDAGWTDAPTPPPEIP